MMRTTQTSRTSAVAYACAILCVFALPFVAHADLIDSFAAMVRVQPDGSAEVSETIHYDFGTEEHHGIYRDIPIEYLDAAGVRREIMVDQIAVLDGKLSPYPFESFKNGDELRIKIGDPDVLVSGKKVYEISYVVHDVVGFFDDHDELYWNVTGNAWDFQIQHSSVRVYAPASTTQSACYIGEPGSTSPCGMTQSIAGDGSAVFFEAGRPLYAGEGLTVAVGWAKGAVMPPPAPSFFYIVLTTYGWMLIPVIAFVFMYRRWDELGRDEKGRGTIIPEYDAPKGMSPALMYEILNEGSHPSVVSAMIIDLAVHGYLKIHRVEEKSLGIFKSISYRFEKLKPSDASLATESLAVYNALFKERDTVTDDELKQDGELVKAVSTIGTAVGTKAVSEGYFRSNPTTERVLHIGSAVIVAVTAFIAAAKFESAWAFIAIMLSAVIVAFFGYNMPAKTKKGALTREYILGLKEYLQIAEKNRLDFHNAPEKSPELFEKLLPYAMVLGVSAAWAKEFEDMQRTPPKWYDGGSYAAFTPVVFAGDMSAMSTSVTSLSSPTSNSGGSSGGGSSGGGFGGGGGGSW